MTTTVGKALLDMPMQALITNMGLAIAESQQALDLKLLEVAQMMAGEYTDASGNKQSSLVKFDGEYFTMFELGFTPTMYQLTDTSLELKVSVSVTSSEEKSNSSHNASTTLGQGVSVGFFSLGVSTSVNVSVVSAEYSSKYQYTAEGSSVLRTKVVPLPLPALLEQRIRKLVDRKAKERLGV